MREATYSGKIVVETVAGCAFALAVCLSCSVADPDSDLDPDMILGLPDPIETDPRIRIWIRTKMSLIRNTAIECIICLNPLGTRYSAKQAFQQFYRYHCNLFDPLPISLNTCVHLKR